MPRCCMALASVDTHAVGPGSQASAEHGNRTSEVTAHAGAGFQPGRPQRPADRAGHSSLAWPHCTTLKRRRLWWSRCTARCASPRATKAC